MISYEEARREGRSRLRCKNKAIRGRAWTVRSLPFSDVPRVVILLSEVLVDAASQPVFFLLCRRSWMVTRLPEPQ